MTDTDTTTTETTAPAEAVTGAATAAETKATAPAPATPEAPPPAVDPVEDTAEAPAEVAAPQVAEAAEDLTDEQIAHIVHEALRAHAEVRGDTSVPSWGWNTLEQQVAQINAVAAARIAGPPMEKPEDPAELIRVSLTYTLLRA